MLNPSAPNVTRQIHLTYVTDDNGDMEIKVDSEGFDEDPRAVSVFLSATIACLSEVDSPSDTLTE
jgi:predicted dinucleotide-utilizing enzyme